MPAILVKLRANRKEIVEVLPLRSAPLIPPEVRMLEWNLKSAPVVLERFSVV